MEFRRHQIAWLNKNVSMRELIEYEGIEIENSGRCFCPFHYNVNTPAAKFFDEGNDLRCFTEGRSYKAFDMMTKVLNWQEDRIRALLPDELSFDYGLDAKIEIKVPVITESEIHSYNNVFGLLKELDRRWVNKDHVECIVINR